MNTLVEFIYPHLVLIPILKSYAADIYQNKPIDCFSWKTSSQKKNWDIPVGDCVGSFLKQALPQSLSPDFKVTCTGMRMFYALITHDFPLAMKAFVAYRMQHTLKVLLSQNRLS